MKRKYDYKVYPIIFIIQSNILLSMYINNNNITNKYIFGYICFLTSLFRLNK